MNNSCDTLSNKLHLLSKLSYYANNGIKLYVQDKPLSPEQAFLKVMEGGDCYMADFVDDDLGELSEIRFDRVEDCLY